MSEFVARERESGICSSPTTLSPPDSSSWRVCGEWRLALATAATVEMKNARLLDTYCGYLRPYRHVWSWVLVCLNLSRLEMCVFCFPARMTLLCASLIICRPTNGRQLFGGTDTMAKGRSGSLSFSVSLALSLSSTSLWTHERGHIITRHARGFGTQRLCAPPWRRDTSGSESNSKSMARCVPWLWSRFYLLLLLSCELGQKNGQLPAVDPEYL